IDPLLYISTISISWGLLSVYSKFYEVYRYTREVTIASLLVKQMLLFTLVMLAFSGFNNNLRLSPNTIVKYVLFSFIIIGVAKFAIYYLLQKYRTSFGGNYRKTVILGKNKHTLALENFFNKNPEYGYTHKKTFSFKERKDAELMQCFDFILKEQIDEIYCSITELTNNQILQVVDFADNNLKILKFLPDNKEIYSKKMKYENYEYIPILSLRD